MKLTGTHLGLVVIFAYFGAQACYANEIYINQIGNNLTLEVQQRSEDNYVSLNSNGGSNNITIRQGMHEDGTIDADETGGHEAYWSVTGDSNTVASYQTDTNRGGGGGNPHHLANIIDGDGNTVEHIQMGKAGHDGFIEITGDNNDVELLQRGNGGVKWADIVLDGDGHTVDSDQRGTGSANLALDLTNNGGAYSVTTNQNTSTTHRSYSLIGTCTNANGCTVNVTQY